MNLDQNSPDVQARVADLRTLLAQAEAALHTSNEAAARLEEVLNRTRHLLEQLQKPGGKPS